MTHYFKYSKSDRNMYKMHINQSHFTSLQRITAPSAPHSLQQSTLKNQHSTIDFGLWDLAGLTPWIGGSAVYTARIILGYDPDEHGVPYRLKDTSHVVKKQQGVLVYPNPATDIIVLRFRAETKSSSTFCLYDYTGKKVFSKIIPAGIKQISLNVNELSDGLYFYNIDGVGYKDSGKIIKIKQ